MKKILSLSVIPIIIILMTAAVSAENESEYGTGLIWDTWEVIEANLIEEPPVESVLPPSVSLKASFPEPGDQGRQNSCTAWAVAYALCSHQEEVKREWGLDTDEHLFSPAYVYNQINGGVDNGSSISSAMNLIIKQGVAPLSSSPYNEFDYLTQPTDEQKAQAAYFKAKDWHSVTGIDNIKRRLAQGDGVIIGIDIYPDFRRISPLNPVYDVISGNVSGSHTICLIGYDDEKNAFEFINSWGKRWGLEGYGWISYDITDKANQLGRAVGFVMEPNESVFHENDFDYKVSDGTAKIIKYSGENNDLIIPDILGKYPVTEIGSGAFSNCASLTSVTISDSVVNIDSGAFSNCASLTSVIISDSVVNINSGAFSNCKSLTEVTIGKGVNKLGESAFHYCGKLNNISVSKDNGSYTDIDGVLFDKNESILILYPTGREGAYIIPEGVTEIAPCAFYGCEELTDVKMPSSLIKIGYYSFWNCSGLTEVIIPEGAEYIDDGAFRFCTGVKTVTVPESVTYIAEEAFDSPYIPMFEAYATIRCYENSCAHKHAVKMDIPFEIIDRKIREIKVTALPNKDSIAVKNLLLTDAEDGSYKLSVNFEQEGEIFLFLAAYEEDALKKVYLGGAEIEGVEKQDLENGKIFIWNKRMEPCIKPLSGVADK